MVCRAMPNRMTSFFVVDVVVSCALCFLCSLILSFYKYFYFVQRKMVNRFLYLSARVYGMVWMDGVCGATILVCWHRWACMCVLCLAPFIAVCVCMYVCNLCIIAHRMRTIFCLPSQSYHPRLTQPCEPHRQAWRFRQRLVYHPIPNK